MPTLEKLRGRVESAQDLQSVVRTMKGLAAVSIRQYQRAVESLQIYARTVELALQVLLRDHRDEVMLSGTDDARDGEAPLVAVVFGSDQGMVGPFNSRVMSFAMEHLRDQPQPPDRWLLVAMGRRLAAGLQTEGLTLQTTYTLPSAVDGIIPSAQDVLLKLQQFRQEQHVGRIVLFHNRPLSGASYEPVMRPIFPLDLNWMRELAGRAWPTKRLPEFAGSWETMLATVLRQQLFVSLYRAFAESLAAEHASRMAAMQAADQNIQERLERLHMQFYQQRQTAITEELLDVIAGFEAAGKE